MKKIADKIALTAESGGRLNYIDSIKFIVCVLVFVGHFYYGFYTAASKTPDLSKMVVYTHTLCRFFFSRVFTVSVFSFLSGYLISSWTIQSMMRLRQASTKWSLLSVRILRRSSKRSSVIALLLSAPLIM